MKTIALAFMIGLAAIALPSTAGATAVTWPAQCTTFACGNSHMNVQHTTIVGLRAKVAALSAQVAALSGNMATFQEQVNGEIGALQTWKSNVVNCLHKVNLTQYSKGWYDYYGNWQFVSYLNNTSYGDSVDYQMIWDSCSPPIFP